MSTVTRKRKGATIGVIGLGYVGLPLAVASQRLVTTSSHLTPSIRKIAAIDRGDSYIEDVSDERLQKVLTRRHRRDDPLRAGSRKADAVVICVPTPLTRNREPELGPLYDAAPRPGATTCRVGQLIVLESTTFPGTTASISCRSWRSPGSAGSGLQRRVLARARGPGRTDYTLRNTPKVVGGVTEECTARAEALYARDLRSPRGSLHARRSAELAKLLENIFRSVNIALVNEMAIIADRMDIDIWEIVEAAATKPYGSCASTRDRVWAATACRWTRSTSPGERASSTRRPSSSSLPARSTSRCPPLR